MAWIFLIYLYLTELYFSCYFMCLLLGRKQRFGSYWWFLSYYEVYERLTVGGDKMELPLQIKSNPQNLSKFRVCHAGATEVSRRDKGCTYIPAGSDHSPCVRMCLVMPQLLEVQEPQWPLKIAKTPVSSLKCGIRIMFIVVTVPRELVSIRSPSC